MLSLSGRSISRMKMHWSIPLICAAIVLIAIPAARAQQRPYIGYVYPAGGQQGATFEIRLGGQAVDDTVSAIVSGKGVSAKVVERLRRLNNQEVQLLREQMRELKKEDKKAEPAMMMSGDQMAAESGKAATDGKPVVGSLVDRLQSRVNGFVQTVSMKTLWMSLF